MRGRRWVAALALALSLLGGGGDLAEARPKKGKKRYQPSAVEKRGWDASRKERVMVKGQPILLLESVDLTQARAVVWVKGVSRPPAARLFAFHDARDRHFIALGARCEARLGEAEFRCELDLPRHYLKGDLRSFTVHAYQNEIRADTTDVQAKFAAARVALSEAQAAGVPTPPAHAAPPAFADPGMPAPEEAEAPGAAGGEDTGEGDEEGGGAEEALPPFPTEAPPARPAATRPAPATAADAGERTPDAKPGSTVPAPSPRPGVGTPKE